MPELPDLPPDVRTQALASLRRFCADELDAELSEIQLVQLLQYIQREFAPTAFNAGVSAAVTHLRDRLADAEAACQLAEFEYWPKGTSVRRKSS